MATYAPPSTKGYASTEPLSLSLELHHPFKPFSSQLPSPKGHPVIRHSEEHRFLSSPRGNLPHSHYRNGALRRPWPEHGPAVPRRGGGGGRAGRRPARRRRVQELHRRRRQGVVRRAHPARGRLPGVGRRHQELQPRRFPHLQHGQEPLGGADAERDAVQELRLQRLGPRRHRRVVRRRAGVQQGRRHRRRAAPQGGPHLLLLGELRRRAVRERPALRHRRRARAGTPAGPQAARRRRAGAIGGAHRRRRRGRARLQPPQERHHTGRRVGRRPRRRCPSLRLRPDSGQQARLRSRRGDDDGHRALCRVVSRRLRLARARGGDLDSRL